MSRNGSYGGIILPLRQLCATAATIPNTPLLERAREYLQQVKGGFYVRSIVHEGSLEECQKLLKELEKEEVEA
jgi:hypothetical protein